MWPTNENTFLQRNLQIFDSTWKTILCLYLLVEKAKYEISSPCFVLNWWFFSVFSFFLFTSLMKDDGQLETHSPSKVPTLPLKPKGIGKGVQWQAQVTPDYSVADSRAWAGIIIYFHSLYITEHTNNAKVPEYRAASRCWKSLDFCVHVCVCIRTSVLVSGTPQTQN